MLPDAEVVQAHRADLVLFLLLLLRRPVCYFIHNQATGLTSSTSDSFWRWLAPVHHLVEGLAVRRAVRTTVFNPDYADQLRRRGVSAVSAPTWWDPALVVPGQEASSRERIVLWVGRLERPKDPHLAVQVCRSLVSRPGGRGWSMRILGHGSLFDELQDVVAGLPEEERPVLLGAVTPEVVAAEMGRAHTLLMTSHPGYEGYPRALVEGMASGLIPVVTEGSDTAGLVSPDLGAVTDRDPAAIAEAVLATSGVDREAVRSAVAHLSAPRIIADVLEL
jgi:glycosyltransferase involved in cell wall biosynthesis